MDCINLYFNGVLQNQVRLDTQSLTIGRADDNDICIANPGVSAYHAVIQRQGQNFEVLDRNSKNGTYVNNQRINRVILNYGDSISIFKHELKFTPLIQSVRPDASNDDVYQFDSGATVMLDRSQIDALLERNINSQSEARTEAGSHLLLTQHDRRIKFPLDKPSFSIGKSSDCDFHVQGWLVPKLAAKLNRVGSDYYIYPLRGGRVFVNGRRIKQASKLHRGDDIAVRKLQLRYLP